MEWVAVIALSVLAQGGAAVLALRLVSVTGYRAAWILIASAISLMTVRRLIPLYHLAAGTGRYLPDPWLDSMGLLLSLLMLAGVAMIEPIFRARERAEEELREALANVRTLRGLLPICAWCKRIRDDRGYWKQLEVYLSEHTEAGFTHGVCSECAEVLREESRARR